MFSMSLVLISSWQPGLYRHVQVTSESTSCMQRRRVTAAKELHRATEAEPKEEHNLRQA